MKILLTGATGFVGSHIARRLARDGHELFVLIRPGSDTSRIADVRGSMQVVSGDLAHIGTLRPSLPQIKPELCLHAAWQIEPRQYLESENNLRWLPYSWELVQAVADAGCPWFIGIGSSLEYGAATGKISEQMPAVPRSLYGAGKLGLSMILEQLCRLRNMRFSWLRLFYPYGPQDYEWRLIPYVIDCLLRGERARVTAGEQLGDFLHVEDMAAAVGEIVRHQVAGVVNIGSGTPVKIKTVVETIGRLTGRADLIQFGALQDSVESTTAAADISLLVRATGFNPQHTLETGLQQTVEWFQAQLNAAPAGHPKSSR